MQMIHFTKIAHCGSRKFLQQGNDHILTFEYRISFLEHLDDLQYNFFMCYRNNIKVFSFYEDLIQQRAPHSLSIMTCSQCLPECILLRRGGMVNRKNSYHIQMERHMLLQ